MEKMLNIKALLLLSALILFANVGSFGVAETSDARYAEIAREMYVSGDYLHPNLLDIHHYHKPPLTYQITALGYKLFGINSFGARFFLQISFLIQMLLVYKICFLLFSEKRTALLSSIAYFTMPIALASSRNLTTDSFLTTFAMLSIFSWITYRKQGKLPYLYIFYIALSLGFLTKGPVIFIVPFVFVLAYNFVEIPKHRLNIHHMVALILFLTISLSWYLYLTYYNNDFFSYFIGKQTVDRFSKNVFNRTEPFWYFIVIAPLLGLPWLPVLPYLIKFNKNRFKIKSNHFVLLVSFLIPLLFFSISSSKRPMYILPFYPVLAILITQLIISLDKKQIEFINKIILGFSLFISSLFIIAPVVQQEYAISKSFIPIGLGVLLSVITIFKNTQIAPSTKPFFMSFLAAAILLTGSSNVLSLNELKINISKPVTEFIIKKGMQDREILVYNRRLPSIAFGLNKSIISLNDGSRGLQRETQFEEDLNWKKYLINMKDKKEVSYIQNIIKTRPTVFLAYKHLPAGDRKWLLDSYQNKKKMGRWYICF
jgi:4-amino-4-deoxy-L-arabinose transferase